MKKIFTYIFLALCTAVSAQQKVAGRVAELHSINSRFVPLSILEPVTVVPSAIIERTVDKATFAKIKTDVVNDIARNQYETIEVEIPYQGTILKIDLYKVNLFNENFHLDTDKAKAIAFEKGAHYRGIIKGNSRSLATFNFFNGEMNAIVSSPELTNLVVGKVGTPNNIDDYIIYSDANLKVSSGFNCDVKDDPATHDDHTNTSRSALTERCVTMYFEIDNDIFQENDSNIEQTTNWMTSVFNNVQTLFNNDGITVSLKSTYIWTTPDPYFGEQSYDYLFQFSEFRPVFDGDVGQLIGIDPDGLGGVAATIDGLCSQENYSYSDVNINYNTVPVYSWTIQVITHEMGHLLGSRHTHSCAWNGNGTAIDNCGPSAQGENGEGFSCMTSPPTIPSTDEKGTIMSYCHLISGVGISFSNGFGPQPTAAIINNIEGSACLSTDCITTCINTVASIDVTNVTSNSASFTWTDLGDITTSWEVNVMLYNSTASNWVTVEDNTLSTSSLLPNTFYKARVRPICGSGVVPTYRQIIFATPADWCSGVVITDTGGEGANYGDMQSYVRTLIPTVPDNKITIEFTEFDLEQDFDYLYVYSGASTTAPQILALTGNELPGSIVSTAADGSLTLEFYSDQAVTEGGFSALVNCETTLSVDGFKNIDFTYYPNPTNGFVNIISKTAITEIAVYNIAGQLLYRNSQQAMDAKVDVSAYATGTYFFKLKFDDREANFKILKN